MRVSAETVGMWVSKMGMGATFDVGSMSSRLAAPAGQRAEGESVPAWASSIPLEPVLWDSCHHLWTGFFSLQ